MCFGKRLTLTEEEKQRNTRKTTEGTEGTEDTEATKSTEGKRSVVLMVSYYFPPAGGPGVQRVAKHVKFLRDFGYEPIVLTTTAEDYSKPSELSAPTDASLVGEIPGDIQVERVASRQPFRLLGWLRRMRLDALRELVFVPDTAITWILPAVKRARQIARRRRVDLIYTSVKPHSAAIIGWMLKRTLGVPWIIDFRDPWTQYFLAVFPTRLHFRFEQWLERFLLRRADHIIAITPTARENLLSWCDFLSPDRVSAITNGYDDKDFEQPVKRASTNGSFRLVYSGVFCGAPIAGDVRQESAFERTWRNVRRWFSYSPRRFDRLTHSPKFLLDALRELFSERPELRGRIKLLHIGPFDKANSDYARELGIEGAIDAPGYVSHTKAVELVSGADALFFCLADSPAGERNDCVPQKVYEYLGSRRPVLALTPEGDARDFFRSAGTAVVCSPRSISEIKAGVLALADGTFEPRRNEEFIRRFERRNLTRQLAAVFDQILGRNQ